MATKIRKRRETAPDLHRLRRSGLRLRDICVICVICGYFRFGSWPLRPRSDSAGFSRHSSFGFRHCPPGGPQSAIGNAHGIDGSGGRADLLIVSLRLPLVSQFHSDERAMRLVIRSSLVVRVEESMSYVKVLTSHSGALEGPGFRAGSHRFAAIELRQAEFEVAGGTGRDWGRVLSHPSILGLAGVGVKSAGGTRLRLTADGLWLEAESARSSPEREPVPGCPLVSLCITAGLSGSTAGAA